mgnify:FL=1
MMRTIKNKKKIYGSIYGGYVGDALGFLVEGHSKEYIQQYYIPKVLNGEVFKMGRGYNKKTKLNGPIYKKDIDDCEWFYPFGQYTDDSQLSRLVLETISENKGFFNFKKYGTKIAKIFFNKEIIGYGNSTKKAAEKLYNLIDYKFSGTQNALSNGSAMRSDIFGLLFNDQKLYKVVTNCSMMTHMSARAAAGSMCISSFVNTAFNSDSSKKFDIHEFLNNAFVLISNIDKEYAKYLLEFPLILRMNNEDAYKLIQSYDTINWGENKISSGVTSSTLYSIYCFLKNPHCYKDCIIMALSAGGDVDTIAKMAGSISGAFLGIEFIPQEFINKLNDNEKWCKKDINNLINTVFNYNYIKIKY